MTLGEIFEAEKIEYFAPVPLARTRIQKPYLLERCGVSEQNGSALMICVPYYTGSDGNISEYACAEDYHLYFKMLFERIIPRIKALYPRYDFFGFADHSPICESEAAASAGLGIMGEHGLFICEKYSSFVFLGEIVSDMPATEYNMPLHNADAGACIGCGACKRSCPVGSVSRENCISAITQKKGVLSADECKKITACGSAWGCDVCQKVCPYTKQALRCGSIYTPIDFFYQSRIEKLDKDTLQSMDSSAFARRAYAWRGKETVERNLRILGGDM